MNKPAGGSVDAAIAEATYTAFASKKGQAITARLIVRRVKAPTHSRGLLPCWP
jgi:hypothetical protein